MLLSAEYLALREGEGDGWCKPSCWCWPICWCLHHALVLPQLLVAAGHDCVPLSLHLAGDLGLALGTRFEEAEVIPAEEEGGTPVAAMKMFRAK